MKATMKKNLLVVGITTLLLLVAMTNVSLAEDSKYRLGIQGTHFVTGLSGVMDFSPPWALQGVIDFGVDNFALRVLNRFHNEKDWNAYGFGALGIWDNGKNDDNGVGNDDDDAEFGLGLGVGLEYDWRGLNPSLPPLGWNIELGLSVVPDVDIDFGVGVHWKF